MSAWAEHLGITPSGLTRRLQQWPFERALTELPKDKPSGDATPRKKHIYYGPTWLAARAAAMQRAKGICERCKKAEAVHVHHLMPVRIFAILDDAHFQENLLAVCTRCHGIEERKVRRELPIFKVLLTPYTQNKNTILTT